MKSKIEIRPEIPTIDHSLEMTPFENFQNTTLRPILKMQNALIVKFFEQYLSIKKVKLTLENNPNLANDIEQIVKKDNALKLELRGVIIGHFTIEEYDFYTKDQKVINKRILSMMIKRIVDNYTK